MYKKFLKCVIVLTTLSSGLIACGGGGDEPGKMKLTLRNLYFSDWAGGDPYVEFIEKKFGVQVVPSSYTYAEWGSQVTAAVNANNLTDVFHFDLESFNFGNTYKEWAAGKIIKQLPDDMSKWPNLKQMIDGVSNIDKLKINDHLYGIPLSYNPKDSSKDFSTFTYVYRRDWAKEYGVYKENDVYTWDEFMTLLEKFKEKMPEGDSPLADVEWGCPSITNFYKNSPHAYAYDKDSNTYVNNFLTKEYIAGLEKTKELVKKGLYYEQSEVADRTGITHNAYKAGQVGVFYDNFSLTNYITLRKECGNAHPTYTEEQIDDMTAIMKVKGPDGKFAIEGSENWFSITFLNYDISDEKMNKILDIMDYLLGEEGTRLAVYGIEGEDYIIKDDGSIELIEASWPKDSKGEYVERTNGAKFLRYMTTLGYDTQGFDPLINKKCYQITQAWSQEMSTAKANGNLRIFVEPGEVKWFTGKEKNTNTTSLLNEGNINALFYAWGKQGMNTIDDYKNAFSADKWNKTLKEINDNLK